MQENATKKILGGNLFETVYVKYERRRGLAVNIKEIRILR